MRPVPGEATAPHRRRPLPVASGTVSRPTPGAPNPIVEPTPHRPHPRATATPTTAQPTTVQPTTVQPTTVQPTTVQPTAEAVRPRPGSGAVSAAPLEGAPPRQDAATAATEPESRPVRARFGRLLRRIDDEDEGSFFPPEVESRSFGVTGAGVPVGGAHRAVNGASQRRRPRPAGPPRPVWSIYGAATSARPRPGPAHRVTTPAARSAARVGTSAAATRTIDAQPVSRWSRLRRTRAWHIGVRYGVIAAIAVGAAIVLRAFVIAPYFIPSQSMEPTLHGCAGCSEDHIVIEKISYRLHAPRTGDIVVFNRPKDSQITEKTLVKRVIGVAGEQVSLRAGLVYIDGNRLNEPYLNKACGPRPSTPLAGRSQWTVPHGDVFVMGDNRCNSTDSRVFGPIPDSSIQGRAFAIIWPFSRIKLL